MHCIDSATYRSNRSSTRLMAHPASAWPSARPERPRLELSPAPTRAQIGARQRLGPWEPCGCAVSWMKRCFGFQFKNTLDKYVFWILIRKTYLPNWFKFNSKTYPIEFESKKQIYPTTRSATWSVAHRCHSESVWHTWHVNTSCACR